MTTTLVTGATGFIGSRLVNALAESGAPVRALVRHPAAAAALRRPGVELVQGDLGNPASLWEAVVGVGRVFHCAGLVGDWLSPQEAWRINVEATELLLELCAGAEVDRVVYLSSLSVLGAMHHRGTDESAPCRPSGDVYADSKVEGERVVSNYIGRGGPEVAIVRPGFVYGPGDRQFLPRLIDALSTKQFMYVGTGAKLLNIVYVDDLVDALLRAGSTPAAAGQAYNLTDGTETSLRTFVGFLCEQLGIPAPTRHVPPPLARAVCQVSELVARLRRSTSAPRLNRGRMRFLYYDQLYSVDKARRQLGYDPHHTYREGLPLTLAWYKEAGLLPAVS
jgi:nucleoside-diphosphate-sugar epimerase